MSRVNVPRLDVNLTGGRAGFGLGQAIAIELAHPNIAEDDAHATRWPKTLLVT